MPWSTYSSGPSLGQHGGPVQATFPGGYHCITRLDIPRGTNKVRVGIKLFKQLHLQLWTEKMIVKVEQDLSLEISGHSLDTDRQQMTGRQEGRSADQD